MNRRKTNGLVAAPFTPMRADRSLNLDQVEPYARWLHGGGLAGAFICGTTGESASLTMDERRQLAERWVAAAPAGLRVIVHVGHTALSNCQTLAAHAAEVGADSIACMAPFFFKPAGVAGLVEWCEEVASAAPALPFYYYHMPSMTGVDGPAIEFLAGAASRIPTLAGIKYTYEDLDDFERCLRFENGRYDVLFGRDERLLSAMERGAKGAVGSTYNFAAPLYLRMMEAFDRGEQDSAAALQSRAVALIDACVGSGAHPIAAFKSLMARCGVDCGPTRLPLADLTPVQAAALMAKLDLMASIDGAGGAVLAASAP